MAASTALVGAPSAKLKAIEDAREAQFLVEQECVKLGNNLPPYILAELIGKGSFGRVYRAQKSHSDQLVAVKIINIEEGDSSHPAHADTFSDILKEVNTLKLLTGGSGASKNINCVIDTHLVGQSVWMVTEYCAGGSVATLMKPTGGLAEKWIIPILREVTEAIRWIHKQGVIHRDIKCANVLITETGGVQLCDFGVAGIVEKRLGADKRSTITGTLHWMAPELFDTSISYGTEVDIWAFGSMAFEAATGLPPNVTCVIDIANFGSYLRQNCPRLESDRYSANLRDLVACCLNQDQARRPRIEEVQAHPYISNTSSSFPTESLSGLVSSYRNWERQGGNRTSLFSRGGAQGHIHAPAVESMNDGWNFGTLDAAAACENDLETAPAVDAHKSNVDVQRLRKKPMRRRQPNIRALVVPLEQAFDPTIDISYEDNARTFYGSHSGPFASDLPDSITMEDQDSPEHLIDLDASVSEEDVRQVADMETLRPIRRIELEPRDDGRRRTQDWTFPTASMSSFASVMEDTEAIGPTAKNGLSANPDRDSTLSLIDLDASIFDEVNYLTCSNDVKSDSEPGGSSHVEEPFRQDNALVAKSHLTSSRKISPRMPDAGSEKESNFLSDNHTTDNPALSFQYRPAQWQQIMDNEWSCPQHGNRHLPLPPSVRVMLGKGTQQDLKEELQRMISSLGEHLQLMSDALIQMTVHQGAELE